MTTLANVFKKDQDTPIQYCGAKGIAKSFDDECSILTIRFNDEIEPLVLQGNEISECFNTKLVLDSVTPTARKMSHDLSVEDQIEMTRIRKYIDAHFNRYGQGNVMSCAAREKTIRAVRARLEDKGPMSAATLARHIKAFNQGLECLAHKVQGTKANKRNSKYDGSTRDLALELIDELYLTLEPKKITTIYDLFKTKLISNGIFPDAVPSRATFYTWVKELDPLLVIRKQKGKMAYSEAARNATSKTRVEKILSRVEVDAVHLACGLLDDNGNFLGCPTIYFVMDCYSRCILGLNIQIGRGETSTGVIDSYRHAFLPKDQDLGTINKWVQFGQPEEIVSDGGAAYKAAETQAYIIAAGCESSICATRQAWRKPYIERFFGTLRSQFATLLPGYLGRIDDKRRDEMELRESAKLSLREFKQRLYEWILDNYHQNAHLGLGKNASPQSVWDEQALAYPPHLPHNEMKIKQIAGEQVKRTISGNAFHMGVVINNIRYNDNGGRLKSIGMRLQRYNERADVTCTYNSNDISKIKVLDPFTDEFFEIENTESIERGMSLLQFKSQNPNKFGQVETKKGDFVKACLQKNKELSKANQKVEEDISGRSIGIISDAALKDQIEITRNINKSQHAKSNSKEISSNGYVADGGYDVE